MLVLKVDGKYYPDAMKPTLFKDRGMALEFAEGMLAEFAGYRQGCMCDQLTEDDGPDAVCSLCGLEDDFAAFKVDGGNCFVDTDSNTTILVDDAPHWHVSVSHYGYGTLSETFRNVEDALQYLSGEMDRTAEQQIEHATSISVDGPEFEQAYGFRLWRSADALDTHARNCDCDLEYRRSAPLFTGEQGEQKWVQTLEHMIESFPVTSDNVTFSIWQCQQAGCEISHEDDSDE